MKTSTKTILTLIAVLFLNLAKSFGAMETTKNALTGELMYTSHLKLDNNISNEQAFEMIQKWFTESPEKFTTGNHEQQPVTTTNMANKTAVEKSFENTTPLTSADASAGWVAGHGVAKYYGSELSSIWLAYIEYDVVLEIHNHDVTVTVSHIKYNHFNPANYTAMPIYNLGGAAFNATGGFENLHTRNTFNPDVKEMTAFLNNNLTSLISDLNTNLDADRILTASN